MVGQQRIRSRGGARSGGSVPRGRYEGRSRVCVGGSGRDPLQAPVRGLAGSGHGGEEDASSSAVDSEGEVDWGWRFGAWLLLRLGGDHGGVEGCAGFDADEAVRAELLWRCMVKEGLPVRFWRKGGDSPCAPKQSRGARM